ncbi:hypothetical protein MMC19_005316 [Ptychographa xylographoides]|nr:hypothetical protein [Ptychographa xylographoides]
MAEPNHTMVLTSADGTIPDQPITTLGPLINNAPSLITLFSPAQLRAYPYVAPLKEMINRAFEATHGHITDSAVKRLKSDTQMFEEIAPEFFTYIISSSPDSSPASAGEAPIPYATGSGRRLLPKVEAAGRLHKDLKGLVRPLEGIRDDNERWELKMLVVDPEVQGQGLGTMITGLVEAEIKKRFEQARLASATISKTGHSVDVQADNYQGTRIGEDRIVGPKEKQLLLLLDTIKELNEAYYMKRGFVTTEKRMMPQGTFGSKTGFEYVYMEKNMTA